MKYNELSLSKKKAGKRVGRGIATGQGKTAGRGTKGQKSRSGSSLHPGFEGGQNPLMQRIPKLHGFHSHRTKPENVFTGQLDGLKAKLVDSVVLAEAGLISNPHVVVKLIVKGDVTKAVSVKLPLASESAIAAVQKAGGSFTVVPQLARVMSPEKAAKREEKKAISTQNQE
jgi:large subunit ribosomal protein L15